MFSKNLQKNSELDRLGRIVLNAAAQNEAEADAAADAPFLYARLRARIADEKRGSETNGWLPLLLIARQAMPAMASIALAAAMLTAWSVWQSPNTTTAFDDDVLLDNGAERVVLADAPNLSRDEIFNLVLERNYGREEK